MEYRSEFLIREAVERINRLFAGENEVWLLDFSHFITLSAKEEDLKVKLYGAPCKGAKYSALLQAAYSKVRHYYKFGAKREHFACDLTKEAAPPEPGTHCLYPVEHLETHGVPVTADTKAALAWFEEIAGQRLFGSGIVVAKQLPGIQSNIYLFLARPLGLETRGPVAFERIGAPGPGAAPLSKALQDRLVQVVAELDDLLTGEMVATTYEQTLWLRESRAFAAHEVAHTLRRIKEAEAPELVRGLAIGLSMFLTGGLGLRSDRMPKKVSGTDARLVLETMRPWARKEGIELSYAGLERWTEMDWWIVYVILEGTRNAITHIRSDPPRSIAWDVAQLDDGCALTCISFPHARPVSQAEIPGSRPPILGSGKGTDSIRRLAAENEHTAHWSIHDRAGLPANFVEWRFQLSLLTRDDE